VPLLLFIGNYQLCPLVLGIEWDNLIKEKNVGLVIVDSIIALYRAQLKGMEWLARQQQRLNYVVDFLNRYAENFNLSVVYTNQVLEQVNILHITLKVQVGGNIIAHAATHRFLLRKTKNDVVIIT